MDGRIVRLLASSHCKTSVATNKREEYWNVTTSFVGSVPVSCSQLMAMISKCQLVLLKKQCASIIIAIVYIRLEMYMYCIFDALNPCVWHSAICLLPGTPVE